MGRPYWTEQYLGLPFHREDFNCSHFVEKVLRERFKRDVVFPQNLKAKQARGDNLSYFILDLGSKTLDPQEGDIVVMKIKGANKESNHLGIYVEPPLPARPSVLHLIDGGACSCLHRLRYIEQIQLELDGFYRLHNYI